MELRSTARRVELPAAGIAFGTLALLGVLIGWEGASRAYTVGILTLFRDHLPAVVLVLVAGAALSFFVGRTFESNGEVALAIAMVVATDVAGALLVTLAFDEMRRSPDIVGAVFTETAAGLQIVAIALGLSIGRLTKRPRPAAITTSLAVPPAREESPRLSRGDASAEVNAAHPE